MGRSERYFLWAGIFWLAGCSGVHNTSSNNNGNGGGNPAGITVSVSPTATSVVVEQTVPFKATVTGTSNTAVTWQVAGVAGGNATVGTIDTAGNYTAPAQVPSPSTQVVTAISQADSTKTATARVQVFGSNSNQARQTEPVKLGTSGGNINDKGNGACCGGTLGSLLERNGTFYILSNNHVLARSDQATIGDPITQPGLIETHCVNSGLQTVANLSEFPNLETSGANVDAAIAQIAQGAVDTSGAILSLGATVTAGNVPDPGAPHQGQGIAAAVGEGVAKSGRTSGLTCSTVAATTLTTSVSYQTQCNGGTSFNVTFTNQVSVAGGGFTQSGDSGSLIVDSGTADPVALLYGGSDTDAVGNPVADVIAAFTDQQGNQPSFVGGGPHAVIGCSLTSGAVQPAAVQARTALALDSSSITRAERARDLHAPELLANPYVNAVGVGASIDRPGEAAVLIVVNPGREATPIPATLEGVGTRIVTAVGTSPRGMLEYDAASRVAPVPDVFAVSALTMAEIQRATAVHAGHVNELMKEPGVQGVGITSSADAPGEAALMIYLIRGEKHNVIPAAIDGLRTRVRVSSRFTAGRDGAPSPGCKVPGK